MKIRNKGGPRIDLWGTPVLIDCKSEETPFINTRFCYYDMNRINLSLQYIFHNKLILNKII